MNKFFLTAIAIISLVQAIASLTIDTPAGIVQCQPTLLTWSGGTPPYYLTILPGGQVTANPIQSFNPTSDTSKTWIVNVDPGQSITFALKDSTGETAFTDQVQARQGTDQGCMTAVPGSTDSDSATAVSGTQAVAETAAGAGTTRATNAAASKTTATAHATSTGTGSSESNDAGGLRVGAFEVAGALGLVGMVLF